MPFYASKNGADHWANPDIFDKTGMIAGCPPDSFAPHGQIWGNPVYDWEAMRRDGYRWWLDRIRFQLNMYDMVRIDHFRGFEAFFAVAPDAESADRGRWIKGPGDEFIKTIKDNFDPFRFIAEDLGFLTESFSSFMKKHDMTGLKVLQFAFSSGADNIYLPHNHNENSVVYTGTHDNDTSAGWYAHAPRAEQEFACRYLGAETAGCAARTLIRTAYMSHSALCIIPMQDILSLDSSARMNTPSTVGEKNWTWRLKSGEFDRTLSADLRSLASTYGRLIEK